ncbi:MAG: hypothetical protein ACE5I1_18985 [bacterium]
MSLLLDIQHLTEQTYQQKTGVNLEEFVIGKTRSDYLSQFCCDHDQLSQVARVFFRTIDRQLYVAIYFHKKLIHLLEKNDPRLGLSEKNITPFIIFIEEINHAIHGALRFLEGYNNVRDENFLRELELQAKIDTYLLLKYFLAYFNQTGQLEMLDKLWLKYHLFESQDLNYEDSNIAARYSEAIQLGEKFVRFVDSLPIVERSGELTRFRVMNYHSKKKYIAHLPN